MELNGTKQDLADTREQLRTSEARAAEEKVRADGLQAFLLKHVTDVEAAHMDSQTVA